jgi:hypothetical protein
VEKDSLATTRPNQAALDKPGAHLELPQRLGILPTWAFWNRRDVWRYGRWFVGPVAGLTIAALYTLTVVGGAPYWSAPIFGGAASGAVILATGILERVVRKRRQQRISEAGRLASEGRRSLGPEEK